jgi:hypothetical protein
VYKALTGKPVGKNYLEDQDVDEEWMNES